MKNYHNYKWQERNSKEKKDKKKLKIKSSFHLSNNSLIAIRDRIEKERFNRLIHNTLDSGKVTIKYDVSGNEYYSTYSVCDLKFFNYTDKAYYIGHKDEGILGIFELSSIILMPLTDLEFALYNINKELG
jgi:hypothetical protein